MIKDLFLWFMKWVHLNRLIHFISYYKNGQYYEPTANLNELEKTMKPDDLTKAKVLGQQYSDQYKAKK